MRLSRGIAEFFSRAGGFLLPARLCRRCTRRGACLAGWRLTLPLWCPPGGVLSLSPADFAFSLIFCPHPPYPLPGGKGETLRLFYARGFAPCIPATEPARHRFALPLWCPPGVCPLCRLPTLPIRHSQGGLPFSSPAYPAFSFIFTPIPPRPLPPRGRGDSKFSYARGEAPCIPGAKPARHWFALPLWYPRGACLFGRPPTLPLVYFAAPIPPTPFPSGEGGDSKFISPGASPPAPRHKTAYGTYRTCQADALRRGEPAVRRKRDRNPFL